MLDNAVAESFNSTLEVELPSKHRFTSRPQTRRAVAAIFTMLDARPRRPERRVRYLRIDPAHVRWSVTA